MFTGALNLLLSINCSRQIEPYACSPAGEIFGSGLTPTLNSAGLVVLFIIICKFLELVFVYFYYSEFSIGPARVGICT